MQLSNLPKLKGYQKPKRRVGRGHGSGRVKTSGRGTKGQKSRSHITIGLEGGSRTARLLKRLPYRRGKGNKVLGRKQLVVNLQALNLFPANSVINIKTLSERGILDYKEAAEYGVKILGDGEITVPVKIELLAISNNAAEKVKKAGGEVLLVTKESKKAKA